MVAITNGGTYVLTVAAAASTAFLTGMTVDRLLTATPAAGRLHGIATAGTAVLCISAMILGYAHDFAVERQLPLLVSAVFAIVHAGCAMWRPGTGTWLRVRMGLLAGNVFAAFWAMVAWVI